MYESPIEIKYYNEMEKTLEDCVVKAILKVGINVDRNELIKALEYDRGQYEKGYKDGQRKALMSNPIYNSAFRNGFAFAKEHPEIERPEDIPFAQDVILERW